MVGLVLARGALAVRVAPPDVVPPDFTMVVRAPVVEPVVPALVPPVVAVVCVVELLPAALIPPAFVVPEA